MGKFLVKETTKIGDGNQENTKANDDGPEESIFSSDIPSDVIFPDQLNRYFRDQMHSLTIENGGLRKSLQETQEELSSVKEKLMKMTQPAPVGRVAEMADYKIAQLSKRLREQNAEMECLRTQTREAEAKLKKLEDKTAEQEVVEPVPSQSELAEKDRLIKSLNDKLQASNAKLCDFRNQYQTLKQEMKLAQKVIECEIGEKVALQDLAKDNGSWRGRAQQILNLQKRVQQLQDQLNNTTSTETPASSILRQMEKDRRANYEETSKQLNQKTIQVEDLRKKFEAAKARNKVLENEVVQVKAKMANLAEKSSKDEQVLSALTNQINAFEDRGKAQMQCFTKMQENMKKMQQELELERTKNEQLQRALGDREKRINRLEEHVTEMRKKLHQESTLECADECVSARLDKATDTSAVFNCAKQNCIADMERIRLSELLAVVNKRLTEARMHQDKAEACLRKERYKNAKLETKIARLELEKVGTLKTVRGCYSQLQNRSEPSLDGANLMARQHIEYLEEECLALKTRIETLQMEKESDLKAIAAISEVRENAPPEPVTEVKLTLKNQESPPNDQKNKNLVRTRKLNRKKFYRTPTNSTSSLSFSSEDYKY